MRTRTMAIVVGVSAGLGAIALSVAPVGAQSFGGSQAPLGNVEVTNRVDVSATTPPGTWLAVAGDESGTRLEVGVPGGVAITNTPNVSVTNIPTVALQNGTQVALTSPSLAALTTATSKGLCTYVEGSPVAALGALAANIPASPMTARTAVTITNTSTGAKRVVCVPGGTASATAGRPIYSGGASAKWEGAQAGWALSCICVEAGVAVAGCFYQVEEERCYQ